MLYAPSVGVHAAGLRSRCLGDRPSGLTITFCTVIFGLALLFSSSLWAQEETDTPKPVPILSAGTAFVTNFESGSPHLNPLIAPVILIPIGRRWLIESRATFESDLTQPSGSSEFHGEVEKGVDYAQLDYIAIMTQLFMDKPKAPVDVLDPVCQVDFRPTNVQIADSDAISPGTPRTLGACGNQRCDAARFSGGRSTPHCPYRPRRAS